MKQSPGQKHLGALMPKKCVGHYSVPLREQPKIGIYTRLIFMLFTRITTTNKQGTQLFLKEYTPR